jgi:hypothetical protein
MVFYFLAQAMTLAPGWGGILKNRSLFKKLYKLKKESS